MTRAVGLAALAAVGLCAATPPAWFAGGGLLAVPALAALYLLVRDADRPARLAYLVGAVHVLWFSWSLRHVTGPGYLAIGALGGFYTAAIAVFVRGAPSRLGPWAFAAGLAATSWARAHAPEISYPHGQVAHCLSEWPTLLAPVRVGGECLLNFLLGLLAAGLAELLGRPRAAAVGSLGPGILLFLAASWGGSLVAEDGATEPDVLEVLLVQSDFPRVFERQSDGFTALADATRSAALENPRAQLVVWPESAWPWPLEGDVPGFVRRVPPPIGDGMRLLAGTLWRAGDGRRTVAVLLAADGSLAGLHEKRVSVPGGERAPFVAWLPGGLREPVLDLFQQIIGYRPDQLDGRRRPPLDVAGVPIAALTCFDNAFGWVAREAVGDGARLLAVLSNESWYLQGGELEQMVAMSRIRAMETGTPVLRSTVDGVSCLVLPDGSIPVELPRAPGEGPQVVPVRVPLGPGAMSPWVGRVRGAVLGLSWLAGLLAFGALISGHRKMREPDREP
ncbi:MAG: apolipoprotein N-acyltransferase [Planctomycetota bacterium]|nr:apolipoprotein N-acyltransferase [Planctomycetota bacterium]